MPEMRSVFSSHINRIGYDAEAGELHVHFADGSEVVYGDVPQHVAESVLTAPSIGEALHGSIRGQFEFKYLARRGQRK